MTRGSNPGVDRLPVAFAGRPGMIVIGTGKRGDGSANHPNPMGVSANDDLLITEVKSALAHDGVADGYLVAVDCDHGKIMLSGVVKSARDAKHAGDIAAGAQGVTGVNDQLTWH